MGDEGILENIPEVLKVAPKNIEDNAGPDKALQLQIFENLHEGEEINLLSLASKSFAFYTYLVVWIGLDALLLHSNLQRILPKRHCFLQCLPLLIEHC